MDSLPVFDLSSFLFPDNGIATDACCDTAASSDGPQDATALHEARLSREAESLETCVRMANCLKEAGAIIVRDPRCTEQDNVRFLDMMERYFEQPHECKLAESRPQLHYQVGCTPEGVEVPQCVGDERMRAAIEAMPEHSRPLLPSGPDCKWRYMWRVGKRPAKTSFAELNASPVIPAGFPEWSDVMNTWGKKMIASVEAVSEMLALGLGLERYAFSNLMHEGPHLLAPTGSDLGRHGSLGTVLAGYHSDLNFLTIHGRCRFPGLFIWLRNGRKIPVSVPPGCLLLQAGKQMEWLTAGAIKAGMHEVVVAPSTVAAVDKAKAEKQSLWRVSSTVFGHIASDRILQPLGHFAQAPEASKYPPIAAGAFVEQELLLINLKPRESEGSRASGAVEDSPTIQVGA